MLRDDLSKLLGRVCSLWLSRCDHRLARNAAAPGLGGQVLVGTGANLGKLIPRLGGDRGNEAAAASNFGCLLCQKLACSGERGKEAAAAWNPCSLLCQRRACRHLNFWPLPTIGLSTGGLHWMLCLRYVHNYRRRSLLRQLLLR
mmetsp:Transcript_31390/g.80002  ORF Transcript_31390/g.80002 Transcript_31390/m.80002 type:complete len:144 (-) Transcript_31390:1349-1780(-)